MGVKGLSRVLSGVVQGVDGRLVEVEVDIERGLPSFTVVGLPETSVRESRERVRSAVKNAGYAFPSDRVTVNLAPADIRKEGAGFDLPIAVGILAATGQLQEERLKDHAILGELSLDGRVKAIRGVLPMAMEVERAGLKGILVPMENAREAAVVRDIHVYGVTHLGEVVNFLGGDALDEVEVDLEELFLEDEGYEVDFSDVRGQEHVKRALEIAAAGGHNVLMIGPPGAGKTMMARCLPTILPKMTLEEALETTKIYSVAGLLGKGESIIRRRPFRSPHHTISDAGMTGGGQVPRPGEVSLSHNGVLFLDELPEFRRNVLEVLRQPMEENKVTISRALLSITYPARFMLVAAMNSCPCGYFSDPHKECRCSALEIRRYRAKISGPLMDRIDLHIEVPSLTYKEVSAERRGEGSPEIRKRVEGARRIQMKRFRELGIYCNAQMGPRHIRYFCSLDDEGRGIMERAMDRLGLSARAYGRILKLARTIADLEGSEGIRADHVAEAIQYRSLDRISWLL